MIEQPLGPGSTISVTPPARPDIALTPPTSTTVVVPVPGIPGRDGEALESDVDPVQLYRSIRAQES